MLLPLLPLPPLLNVSRLSLRGGWGFLGSFGRSVAGSAAEDGADGAALPDLAIPPTAALGTVGRRFIDAAFFRALIARHFQIPCRRYFTARAPHSSLSSVGAVIHSASLMKCTNSRPSSPLFS